MTTTLDFNRFGEKLWEITNVFQDDALHATERLETFSLFLFLKLWDEMVLEQEETIGRQLKDNELAIPNKYRFHKWAEDPDGYAKQNGYDDSVDFCRRMFDDLATRKVVDEYGRDITFDIRRIFDGAVLRLRYATTIRALVSKLNELDLREIMMRGVGESGERFDVFGRTYEFLVQQFGQNKGFAEYFTPRHIVDRMLQIIDPGIGETIYDPACGTGGFIVRAFEWVESKINRETITDLEKESLIRDLKENHVIGVEYIPLVFKLALMNMALHRGGSSKLQNDDSLSDKAQDIHKISMT